jgi:5-methylcytosine-specific restriction endonuclease McrA
MCVVCKAKENLEVDHTDPTQKLSHRLWSWTQERREAELAKCQVLCEECHKNKTAASYNPIKHGTNSAYTGLKCRCLACRNAHRLANAIYR